MNVKPGDLAIIIADAPRLRSAGLIVDVLYLAPAGSFSLPDGYPAQTKGGWVVRFQHPVPAPLLSGAQRSTIYGMLPDRYLRPIRPDGITQDDVQQLYQPGPRIKQPETAQ